MLGRVARDTQLARGCVCGANRQSCVARSRSEAGRSDADAQDDGQTGLASPLPHLDMKGDLVVGVAQEPVSGHGKGNRGRTPSGKIYEAGRETGDGGCYGDGAGGAQREVFDSALST